MNSKQFIVLFFNVALMGMANAIWDLGAGATISTVALNGALTLPLASAAAGTLATPLAVLGALKLGAVALLALGLLGNDDGGYEESGYGYSNSYGRFRRRRVQRSAPVQAPREDAVFALVSAMDSYSCGKQLICELEAKNQKELAEDEAVLLKLFSSRKTKKALNVASPKAEYELAAELGMASKNVVLCRERYATCPYNGEQMMEALRNSQL